MGARRVPCCPQPAAATSPALTAFTPSPLAVHRALLTAPDSLLPPGWLLRPALTALGGDWAPWRGVPAAAVVAGLLPRLPVCVVPFRSVQLAVIMSVSLKNAPSL